MTKDWSGNEKSVWMALGASNHTDKERESTDFYATNPRALELFVPYVKLHHKVYEPSCGTGHLSKWLENHGYDVLSTDLVDRGYGYGGIDFFTVGTTNLGFEYESKGTILLKNWANGETFDILTNPPFKTALNYVLHAIDLIPEDGRVFLFLKTLFLEGRERYERIYKVNPPRYVYQYSNRVKCAKNGNFEGYGGSAQSYAFYEWHKHNDKHQTEVKWIV